jgi:hypothetical protein
VTESTKIDRTTIAGTGLLSRSVVLGVVRTAVLLGLPLLVSCHKGVGLLGAAGADDSPVTVRGGSVTLRAEHGFNCPAGLCMATNDSISVADKQVIALDGVQLDNSTSTTLPPYTLNPKMNWELMLTFRKDSKPYVEDPDHFLKICSDPKCNTSTPLVGSQLYLVTDTSTEDNTSFAWGTPDIDESTGVTFHRTKCGTTSESGESPCNHIHHVIYTSNGTSSRYTCKHAQCDIGIGKPPSA